MTSAEVVLAASPVELAPFCTAIARLPDVLDVLLLSPLYWAVMARAPAAAKETLVDALPPLSGMAAPSATPSARKVTLPVGLAPVTEADNVIDWFSPGVVVLDETLVTVDLGETVTFSVEAAALVLFPSPA